MNYHQFCSKTFGRNERFPQNWGVILLDFRGSYCARSGLLDRRRDTEKLQKVMGVTDGP